MNNKFNFFTRSRINIVIAARPAAGSAIRFNGYKKVWEHSPQDYTQIMSDINFYEISEEEAGYIFGDMIPDVALMDKIDGLRKGIIREIDNSKSNKNYKELDEQLYDYYKHFGEEPKTIKAKDMGNFQVVDPGTKTPESMLSNIQRLCPTWPVTLDVITDLARCSILVDSFSQVPEILINLQPQKNPEFTGRIYRRASGYRAVHINFTADGVKNEIQFHSKKTFHAKLAEENNYKKWRDYNIGRIENELLELKEKLETKKELNDPSYDETRESYDAKYLNYQNLIKEKYIDFEMSKELFEAFNKDGDFDRHIKEIQSVLDSFS